MTRFFSPQTFRAVTATATLLASASLAACAQADDPTKTEIEEIVRAYLMENPEVIAEALVELDRKEKEAELSKTTDAIEAFADQIYKDPRDYSIGPKNAKVQIVEFFDYNCGFCKRSTDWVSETIAKHPDDVRVVFKELPVLTGPEGTSFTAARAALAAARQGKYNKFHFAMMSERVLNEQRILQLAKSNGLDADQLKRDMEDASIKRHVNDNLDLASQIPALTGTPFFIVNGEFVSGANIPRLEQMLESALES